MGLLQDFQNCQTEYAAWLYASVFILMGMFIMFLIYLVLGLIKKPSNEIKNPISEELIKKVANYNDETCLIDKNDIIEIPNTKRMYFTRPDPYQFCVKLPTKYP
jgi:hypothetical protein